MDAAVRDLLAKQEIHELLLRYCRGIDRGDLALVLSVFHDDAVDNHNGDVELARERFPRVLAAAAGNVERTSHTLCNQLIEVRGDAAAAESYLVAYHRIDAGGRALDWVLGARYLDRLDRRDGVWRIAERAVVFDWERFDDVAPPPPAHGVLGWFDRAHHGSRNADDPSYQLFDTLHRGAPTG